MSEKTYALPPLGIAGMSNPLMSPPKSRELSAAQPTTLTNITTISGLMIFASSSVPAKRNNRNAATACPNAAATNDTRPALIFTSANPHPLINAPLTAIDQSTRYAQNSSSTQRGK